MRLVFCVFSNVRRAISEEKFNFPLSMINIRKLCKINALQWELTENLGFSLIYTGINKDGSWDIIKDKRILKR